jgi:hypothetical protein
MEVALTSRMSSSRGWVATLAIGGALASWACSDHSAELPRRGAGAPTAGAGGQGGARDDDSSGCTVGDAESHGSDLTLAQLEADCGVLELTSYRTSCGGTYVESDGGVTLATWLFDADGKLIGGSYEDEGTCSSWGSTTCTSVGIGRPLCGENGPCVTHTSCAEWGANFHCPEQLDDVSIICGFAEVELDRYTSDCGGTLVKASNGVQTVDYSFDAEGILIGVSAIGDVGDCDQWGTRCEPVGTAERVFCDAPGGGGEGGVGGAGGP